MDSGDLVSEFKDKVRALNDELTCSVCLSQFANPCVLWPCAHVYCKDCVATLTASPNPECPNCRSPIEAHKEVKELNCIGQRVREVLRVLQPLVVALSPQQ